MHEYNDTTHHTNECRTNGITDYARMFYNANYDPVSSRRALFCPSYMSSQGQNRSGQLNTAFAAYVD